MHEMMGFGDGSWTIHMQTICTSLQTDSPNHTNTSSLNFYRPDALPDAQATVFYVNQSRWCDDAHY